ncbi:MAG TPA: helix-turn-helix transcriptional regulator [Actinomycetota bacterium]
MKSAKDPPIARHPPLGAALAEWRAKAGLSQTELADRVAYHRTTVTHAERGSHVPAAPFWKACDALLGAGGALVRLYEAWRETRRATLGSGPEDEGGDHARPGSRGVAGVEEPTDRREVLKLGPPPGWRNRGVFRRRRAASICVWPRRDTTLCPQKPPRCSA